MARNMAKKQQDVDTMTHEELGDALGDIPGFKEGRKLQSEIMALGDLLRTLREKELGLSQTAAAKLIGIDQPELSRIENGFGRRGPSFLTINRIVDAYSSFKKISNPDYRLGLNVQFGNAGGKTTKQVFLAGSE